MVLPIMATGNLILGLNNRSIFILTNYVIM